MDLVGRTREKNNENRDFLQLVKYKKYKNVRES